MNQKIKRAELLPCPFCGAGKTEIQANGRPWLGTRGWGEPASVSVRHWCEPVDGQPSRMIERVGRDRAAAIDAWNRRAALQSQECTAAMSTTILTDKQKAQFVTEIADYGTGFVAPLFAVVEAIKQAVLQSEQVQAWKRDAERLDWLLRKLPGDAIRYCVGVLDDTADAEEFRSAIDHARRIEGDGE